MTTGPYFRFTAIGLAALVNMIVGGYAGIMSVLEVEGIWTTRFYMLTVEHYWYCVATVLLTISLGLETAAFVMKEDVDVGIIIIATELGFGLCTFVIESIRQRRYRRLLWKSWTGSSRTTRPATQRDVVVRLHTEYKSIRRNYKTIQRKPTESSLNIDGQLFSRKLKLDIADAMDMMSEKTKSRSIDRVLPENAFKKHIYPRTSNDGKSISVRWGGINSSAFRIRVSRGITMFNQESITKSFSLTKTSDEKWIILASGVVSRNKGMAPHKLVCRLESSNACYRILEEGSTWFPRSNKTSRSSYRKIVEGWYDGLGPEYVTAVTEFALILPDVDEEYLSKWLDAECEQQDLILLWTIWDKTKCDIIQSKLYEVSYLSMILSINSCKKEKPERPDITCLIVYAIYLDNYDELLTHKEFLYRYVQNEMGFYNSKLYPAILALLGVSEESKIKQLSIKLRNFSNDIYSAITQKNANDIIQQNV